MQSNNLEEAKSCLKGPIVAMTTPIKEDDSIDYEGLAKLTEFYVHGGIRLASIITCRLENLWFTGK